MGKFGWAYLGCGNIAHTTARELIKTEDQQIVAVWNRTHAKAEQFAEKYGAVAYKTAEEAITAPGVEGVYIAVTADKHAEYMRLCIKHHKPVLCEKPFTVNAKEAEEIFAYAAQEGVYVSEAMWTWHNTLSHKVKDFVTSGKLGTIQSVECSYALPTLKFYKSDRLMNPLQIGGALMDVGIYCVRYCCELFGMPKEIKCEGRLNRGADLGEKILMKYDGFDANITVAFDYNGGEYFRIKGTKGNIDVPWFHVGFKADLNGEKISNKEKHYAVEFSNVAKEIRAGLTDSKIIPAQSTIDCMKLLDECRRQMGLQYPYEMERITKPMKIKAISHLGFNCKDLEKSVAFYRDIIGCTEKFYMTYGDLADAVEREAAAEGKKIPLYAKAMRRFADKKWSVYMQWTEDSFIELFYLMGANKRRIPGKKDLNYTHYSLEVDDIRAFRQQIIARGGAEYLDSEITLGVDNTWQFWMHDPDGNPFEIMEYTPESLQVVGMTHK